MRILKLEQTTHSSGVLGTLVTADTEIPSAITADLLMTKLDSLYEKVGCIIPKELTESDALIANSSGLCCKTPFYSQSVVNACDWLKKHQTENIILGIHSTFVNTSTHTWFITYWSIPYQWTSARRNHYE